MIFRIVLFFISVSNCISSNEVLFFPGLFEYKHQVACYASGPLLTKNGSLFLDKLHAKLFSGDSVSVCKFSEIIEATDLETDSLSLSPLSVLLASLSWLSKKAFSPFWDLYRAHTGRSFTNAAAHYYEIDLTRTNIAGDSDVDAAKTAMLLNKSRNPIVFGVSRGSSAALIALTKDTECKPLCAVFESPFAEFNDTIPASPWLKRVFFQTLYILLPKRQKEAIQCVEQFPQDVPVLFVTSQQDRVVPSSSVKRLAQALAAGNENVYLLELKNSSHKGYTWENDEDREHYQNVVNLFIKSCKEGKSKKILDLYRVAFS